MAETTLWWLFLLACIFAFWFGYGIIESWARKWFMQQQARKEAPRIIDNSPDPTGNGHADSVFH